MLWEFYGTKGGPEGEEGKMVGSCTQLVGVLPPFWWDNRQLHRNGSFLQSREKVLSINKGDIVGHAQLACQEWVNPEWVNLIEVPSWSSSMYNMAR